MDRVKRYRRGAYLEVVLAVLHVPLMIGIILSVVYAGNLAVWFGYLTLAFLFVVINTYLWLLAKDLLITVFGFRKADNLIYAVVAIGIASLVPLVLRLGDYASSDARLILEAIGAVIEGAFWVMIGLRIRKCADDMLGYRDNISMLLILSGVFEVTVILAPIAVLIGVVLCVNMARLYAAASNAMRDLAVAHT